MGLIDQGRMGGRRFLFPLATGCRIALYPLTNDWVMI
jgi:hypothetical protein